MSFLVLALILLTVFASACAQLVLKLGVADQKMQAAMQSGLFDSMFAAALSPFIWGGLVIYALSVALWLWVLSKVDLSVAYPFVGLGFVVTMLFGIVLLNENVTMPRVLGTLLIVGGCVLIGRSA
ncbi:MAG: small multi-drug resistant family protein [Sneathiella sp.]|jgi:multidrug transporter EmrE-like cation transporter|uniref:DMT family transporter n=1 Tax=Sneathiella sp. TaxID=1964365 RepID=UPI000C381DE8|nr:SMR family transporter [Sneathiella sp.]MAL77712.1 small multi-drug resistant family protein [Sneathiella sp.]|tara:strand:+ start:142 stop:516 length:375 start_codon:yes stop_codon:yes gene_type:complete